MSDHWCVQLQFCAEPHETPRQTVTLKTYLLACRLVATLFLLPAAFAPTALAQETPRATPRPAPQEALQVPRVSGEVAVDGRLDEAVWQQAATVELAYEVRE